MKPSGIAQILLIKPRPVELNCSRFPCLRTYTKTWLLYACARLCNECRHAIGDGAVYDGLLAPQEPRLQLALEMSDSAEGALSASRRSSHPWAPGVAAPAPHGVSQITLHNVGLCAVWV